MKFQAEQLEQLIGYRFKEQLYLKQALTHSSYANEQKINKAGDYERLEFLGDAVLELMSSEFLFDKHPDLPEGKLTRMRSAMVCEPALAYCAREIGLDQYILLGKGEEATGGRNRDSIVSDVMEAVLGAIYLDGGFGPAREFVHRFILSDMENKILFYDSKTMLQEMVQALPGSVLQYETVGESGPDHDKVFCVNALLNGTVMGEGKGKTKKAAEQQAAYEAIMKLRKQ